MIDSATPPESWAVARKSDGRVLTLVMSDEFEVAGRQFGKGKDKFFEAIEKPDNTNEAIQFCTYFVCSFYDLKLFTYPAFPPCNRQLKRRIRHDCRW